ncbi:hypothetical protein Q5530_07540 [Saccharothrix sp. BKS2]
MARSHRRPPPPTGHRDTRERTTDTHRERPGSDLPALLDSHGGNR